MNSLFNQFSSAKVQGRGQKIKEDGEFLVRIDAIKLQESNQGFGTLWITEFTILKGTEKNPPKVERSWVAMPNHRPKTDPGNVKAFMAAVLGIENPNEEDIPAEVFEKAVSVENPFAGTILKLETVMRTTKEGRDFCLHTWKPGNPSEVPEKPELTKEAWLKGEGPGTVHPNNKNYEYHPDHVEWGTRPCSS